MADLCVNITTVVRFTKLTSNNQTHATNEISNGNILIITTLIEKDFKNNIYIAVTA